MELRNIHFQTARFIEEVPQTSSAPEAEVKLRLRKVKLSPAEEFAQRSGNPRPISMSLAALILSKTGKAEVKPKGVLVDRTDIGRGYFWHPDSRLCNDLSLRNQKIIYVYTALQPNLIHCLDAQGRYLETLPRYENVDLFDAEASQKAHADKQRQINRVAEHMQRIHQPETDAALAAASHNAMEMQRVVQVMPAPVATPDAAPAPSALGDRIHDAANASHQTYRDLPAPPSRHTTVPTSRQTSPTAAELLLAQAEACDEF